MTIENDETEETDVTPTRQSIDLRRGHLREVEWMEDERARSPSDIAAEHLDAEAIQKAKEEWDRQVRAFYAACPERLRRALESALGSTARITKTKLAKAAGISRVTLNAWIEKASSAIWGSARPPFGRLAV